MGEDAEIDTTVGTAVRRRSFWRRFALPLLLIFALAFAAFWIQRKDIADNVIGSYLRSHHVQATYRIEQIGGTRQVLSHVVIGDPKRPNLTIERAEVIVRYRLGFPGIARLILTRPRLYGTYLAGKVSLGALDPILFTGKKQAFELPDYALELQDGRALIETDHGPVGIKAEGKGQLRGGFAGVLAATAPELAFGGCKLTGATLYGKVSVEARRPAFAGPLRLQSLDCGAGSARMAQTNLGIDMRLDRTLGGADGTFAGGASAARYADGAADALRLSGKTSFHGGELNVSYKLAGNGLKHPQAQLGSFAAEGSLRAGKGFDSLRLETDFNATNFRPGAGFDGALRDMAESADGTMAGALLRKFRSALAREANGSALSGQASLRKTGSAVRLIVPQADLTGASGERLLSLSRFQYGGGALPQVSGNFATGGRDLPRIEGTIEQRGGEGFTARLAMATYQADGGSLAVPSLAVVAKSGRVGFAGRAIVSGDLPGGRADGLLLPLSGNWSSAGGLALWRECTKLTFDSLRFANLTLERHGLTVCPAKGLPIARYGAGGLRVAAGVPSLDLRGRLGTTPIAIRSGPIGLGYPGTLAARQLLVTLGPSDTATTFAINNLTAQIGKTISGHFAGTDAKLAAIRFDFADASGDWDYTNGRLGITNGAFRLVDRDSPKRFEPLVAHGATLSLENSLISASGVLREPATDTGIVDVAVRHDLATGRGHADLAVNGLTFGPHLQPEQLTLRALGVVANVAGTVTGTGRVDWDEKGVTSSGRFSSDALDFAAAFGPVKGASGTLVFTDLIGLTTAPDQILKVASVNPGIEVTGGEVSVQLKGGQVLTVNRGTWPFMGGTLTMRPVTLNLGVSEQRAYVLEIAGLEAAQFVERMQLENLSATGTFDGELPLIFDVNGDGRIEGGRLTSRGGGNISYVGALTYKDLSAMANMAFDALRSLDYKKMDITVEGPLTGEIITHVRFDGVSQGAGAKQNFITRRIGKLPFRFVVTITAPFYQVITNIKSMYDPAMVRNPQDLAAEGLLVDETGKLVPADRIPSTPATPKPTPDEATIQRRESENKP